MAHPNSILPCLHGDPTNPPLRQALSQRPAGRSWVWHELQNINEERQINEAELLRYTRGEDQELIGRAIELKKTNAFAKRYRQVLQHLGSEEIEWQQPPIRMDMTAVTNMFTLQWKDGPYYNTYELYFIKLDRGNFSVKRQEVVYGNCPECLRAMPLGTPCPQHPAQGSKYIYMAHDAGTQADVDFNYVNLQTYGFVPMDPVRLSEYYVNRKPIYTFNYQTFKNMPNYGGSEAADNYCVFTPWELAKISYQSPNQRVFLASPVEVLTEVSPMEDDDAKDAVKALMEPMLPSEALPVEHKNRIRQVMNLYYPGWMQPVAQPNQVQSMELDEEDEDLFY